MLPCYYHVSFALGAGRARSASERPAVGKPGRTDPARGNALKNKKNQN